MEPPFTRCPRSSTSRSAAASSRARRRASASRHFEEIPAVERLETGSTELKLEPWLFVVAAASYFALVLITYFDEAEVHRVAEAARPNRRP